jgi:hypothetical protein
MKTSGSNLVGIIAFFRAPQKSDLNTTQGAVMRSFIHRNIHSF